MRQEGSEEESREQEREDDQQSEVEKDMDMERGFEKDDEQLAKPLRDLGAPTPLPSDMHFLSHIPFRSWCPTA